MKVLTSRLSDHTAARQLAGTGLPTLGHLLFTSWFKDFSQKREKSKALPEPSSLIPMEVHVFHPIFSSRVIVETKPYV